MNISFKKGSYLCICVFAYNIFVKKKILYIVINISGYNKSIHCGLTYITMNSSRIFSHKNWNVLSFLFNLFAVLAVRNISSRNLNNYLSNSSTLWLIYEIPSRENLIKQYTVLKKYKCGQEKEIEIEKIKLKILLYKKWKIKQSFFLYFLLSSLVR